MTAAVAKPAPGAGLVKPGDRGFTELSMLLVTIFIEGGRRLMLRRRRRKAQR